MNRNSQLITAACAVALLCANHAEAVLATHSEAHGFVSDEIGKVVQGE